MQRRRANVRTIRDWHLRGSWNFRFADDPNQEDFVPVLPKSHPVAGALVYSDEQAQQCGSFELGIAV